MQNPFDYILDFFENVSFPKETIQLNRFTKINDIERFIMSETFAIKLRKDTASLKRMFKLKDILVEKNIIVKCDYLIKQIRNDN